MYVMPSSIHSMSLIEINSAKTKILNQELKKNISQLEHTLQELRQAVNSTDQRLQIKYGKGFLTKPVLYFSTKPLTDNVNYSPVKLSPSNSNQQKLTPESTKSDTKYYYHQTVISESEHLDSFNQIEPCHARLK